MNTLLHWLLGGFCHQLPARSLAAHGATLPLCARCTGLHLAAAATLLFLHLHSSTRHRSGLPGGAAAWALGGLAALWLVDGINSTLYLLSGAALYIPNNALRLLTGVGMGLGLGMLLHPLLQGISSLAPLAAPVVDHWTALLGPLLASAAAVAMVLLTPWEIVRSLLLAGCALTTLAVANGLAIAALAPPWRDVRSQARRGIAPLGLLVALAEVLALMLLRGSLA